MRLPALYQVADQASNAQQKLYFFLVGSEYVALVIASSLSVNVVAQTWYIGVYGAVIMCALGVLGYRSVFRPERKWYQARALAESVKTTAWKYAMGARPFEHSNGDRAQLRQILTELLETNRDLGGQFDSETAAGDQVTEGMEALRTLPPLERLQAYMNRRVENQLSWYVRKSQGHKAWGLVMACILGALYIAAFGVLATRVLEPSWIFAHPDPIIVLAASVLGWMQIKRFNELAASYSLTASEIAILKSAADEVLDEETLSAFIDDAEEAFSREHTQWLARRSAS